MTDLVWAHSVYQIYTDKSWWEKSFFCPWPLLLWCMRATTHVRNPAVLVTWIRKPIFKLFQRPFTWLDRVWDRLWSFWNLQKGFTFGSCFPNSTLDFCLGIEATLLCLSHFSSWKAENFPSSQVSIPPFQQSCLSFFSPHLCYHILH